MAADIGVRIGIEGEKTFKSALSGINAQLKNLNSEMKATVSAMSGMGDEEASAAKKTDILSRSVEASKQKIQLISNQYDQAKATLDELGRELDDAKQKFGENSTEAIKAQNAYNYQAAAVNKLGTQLNDATAEMNRMEAELRDIRSAADRAEGSLDDLADAAEDAGREGQGAGNSFRDAFAGGVVSGLIQSAVDGMRNLVDSTKEYRQIMGSLEISSAKAGYSADQTSESYKQLYGVLGDEQSSATALANLQALNLSQEQLTAMIDGTIGAWATYGDSIPIDSLGEAINETIRVGKVTGTFADMLNWAGSSEDEFNKKLAAANTESERANLVLEEMANQGLIGAADAWRNLNPELVAANEAQLAMNNSLGNLSTVISPAVTTVTDGIASLIDGVTTLIQDMEPFVPILAGAATAATLFGIAINIGSILTGFSTALSMVTGAFKTLFGVMAANPIALVVSLIVGLVTAFITAYNTSDEFRAKVDAAFKAVNDAGKAMVDGLKGFFTDLVDAFKMLGEEIGGALSSAKEKISETFENIKTAITEKANAAKEKVISIFDAIKTTISDKVTEAKTTVENIFNGIKTAITDKIDAAKDAVKRAIDKIKSIMDFEWSLPKLKLPHISISGSFSLNPPSVPKFGIEWYKDGGVMMSPTIFGMAGSKLLAGGEAGPEAIAPISVLQDYVSAAVDDTMSRLFSGLVNGMQTAMSGAQGGGTYTFNLMLPDGTTLARYQLPALIEVARANGTPILNPM